MADKTYWLDVAERALKTACQAAAGVLAGSTLVDMDWPGALAIVGTAVLGSLLTSLASLPVGEVGSASALHVPRVSHDQVIDTIERAAEAVQARTTSGVTAKLDEILRHVKPVEVRITDVRVKKIGEEGGAQSRPPRRTRQALVEGVYPGSQGMRDDPAPGGWFRPGPDAVAALGRHAAVDAQTGEDDDTTPTPRPSWGRP